MKLLTGMVTRYPGAGTAVANNKKLKGAAAAWCVNLGGGGKGDLTIAMAELTAGITEGSRGNGETGFVLDFVLDAPGIVAMNVASNADVVERVLECVVKRMRYGLGIEDIGTYVRIAVEPLASPKDDEGTRKVKRAFLRLLGGYLRVVKYLNLRTGEDEEEGNVITEVQMTAVRESSVHLAPLCNGFIKGVANADKPLPAVELLGPGVEMVVSYLVASTPTPTNGGMKEEDVKSGVFLPAVDGLEEGLRRILDADVVEQSIDVVFGENNYNSPKHEELLTSIIRGACALGVQGDLASKLRIVG